MASIVKRKKKYSVVYTYTDENGNKRQKWETFETNAEAKKRKLQVEYEQESGTFIPPSAKTVNDLLDEYMSIYGVNTWAMSTYESRKSLIANYIRPLIGDMKLEDVTPRIMDKYYRDLLSVKAVSSKYVKARTEYLTPHTVREVHKTLRNAFSIPEIRKKMLYTLLMLLIFRMGCAVVVPFLDTCLLYTSPSPRD